MCIRDRVTGPVNAGQSIWATAGGVATAQVSGVASLSALYIVGIALKSKETEDEGLVECILKV